VRGAAKRKKDVCPAPQKVIRENHRRTGGKGGRVPVPESNTKFQCLALLEKEPALKLPLDLAGGVGAGSTTFRWRAIQDETGHYWEETSGFP